MALVKEGLGHAAYYEPLISNNLEVQVPKKKLKKKSLNQSVENNKMYVIHVISFCLV